MQIDQQNAIPRKVVRKSLMQWHTKKNVSQLLSTSFHPQALIHKLFLGSAMVGLWCSKFDLSPAKWHKP